MRVGAVVSVLMVAATAWAVSPSPVPALPITVFRTEVAEVDVPLAVYDRHQTSVTDLSPSDFTVLLDGRRIHQPVILERRQDSPIRAIVMTDISDSMARADFMARDCWHWMRGNLLRPDDRVKFFEFGGQLQPSAAEAKRLYSTSLYDCVVKVLQAGAARGVRTLMLFTDGQDNMSMHGLSDVIRLAAKKNIRIYAFTTSRQKVSYDEDVLDSLTGATGGRLFVVQDTKQMIAAVQQIGQQLRNGYELVFRADTSRPGMHRIAIEANDKRLTFYYRGAYFQPAERTAMVANTTRP